MDGFDHILNWKLQPAEGGYLSVTALPRFRRPRPQHTLGNRRSLQRWPGGSFVLDAFIRRLSAIAASA
jgi:hypothetical protein